MLVTAKKRTSIMEDGSEESTDNVVEREKKEIEKCERGNKTWGV